MENPARSASQAEVKANNERAGKRNGGGVAGSDEKQSPCENK
jgi:hypothetical protein